MSRLEFPYQASGSRLFGRLSRPVVTLQVFSFRHERWFGAGNIIADTGADYSIFPFELGLHLVRDISSGRPTTLSGVVPDESLAIYVHTLKLRIGSYAFAAPVGLATRQGVPAVLGRHQALDRFTAIYRKGRKLILER